VSDITLELLDKLGACCRDDGKMYSDERLRRLWPGRESITPLELASDRRIPCADRVWVLVWVCPELAARFANDVADRAVRRHCLGTVIDEWARRWLSGEDRSLKAAALAADAAWAASAAGSAEWAAAWVAEAAHSAAESAGREGSVAAWSAAWAGATAAAEATVWPAERQRQVKWWRDALAEREVAS
jgi:hypothetical protein